MTVVIRGDSGMRPIDADSTLLGWRAPFLARRHRGLCRNPAETVVRSRLLPSKQRRIFGSVESHRVLCTTPVLESVVC